MILINLLPDYREEARKRRKEQFQLIMVLALLLGGVLAAIGHMVLQMRMDAQHERNQFIQANIVMLDRQIEEIDQLEKEIADLRARQKAVEDLQAGRNLPVHMFNELMRQLPEGVYITSLKQSGDTVEVRGSAQSNERVSELLRNLSSSSTWFTSDKLEETVASTVALSPGNQRKIVNYVLRFSLARAPATRLEVPPGQESLQHDRFQ